jgi:GNAT superfamily N-acetyltransferase
MNSLELKTTTAADKVRSIELLRQGFEHEPTYRWCLCADECPGYEERLARCMQADYEYHKQYGFIVGAYSNHQLIGVAYMQPPNMAEIGAAFPWIEILTQCGAETLKRIEFYIAEIATAKFVPLYHKLSFVSVDEQCRGQGIGTALLANVDELMRNDPTSMGIQLETSNPDNVRLYERHGYRVMQEKNFYGIQQYLMLKPRA